MTEQCLLIYCLLTSEMVMALKPMTGGSHAPWLSVVCFFWGAETRTLRLTLGKMEQSLQIVWSFSTCLSLFLFRGSEKIGVVQSRLIRRWCGGVHTYDVSFMLVRKQVLINSIRGGGVILHVSAISNKGQMQKGMGIRGRIHHNCWPKCFRLTFK